MQDKAIAAIGEWQLKKNKDLEPVDLYIENMFPGKDYQLLMLVFDLSEYNGRVLCEYKGIDIEKVSSVNYSRYAYRGGSSRGGDITFTTKVSKPDYKKIEKEKDNPVYKKIESIEKRFKALINDKKYPKESFIFKEVNQEFINKKEIIRNEVLDIVDNLDKKTATSTGITLKLLINGETKYLRDFEVVKSEILKSAEETKYKRSSPKAESKTSYQLCSVSGKRESKIYGFAAPFSYSTPDKPGFVSNFFNIKANWKNYPISAEAAVKLELGSRFIINNLSGYFYGYEYLIIPNPIINTNGEQLSKIINMLRLAFTDSENSSKERKRGAEEHVLKVIGSEAGTNHFNLDIAFYKKVQSSMRINLMIEEILPSRFRTLFIDIPEKVNRNKLFENAITIKREQQNLRFSYRVVKDFFEDDFLTIVHKLFVGKVLSSDYVFECIMKRIQKKYNDSKVSDSWVEPTNWIVKKSIMLLSYLTKLEIISVNQNYTFMELENKEKKETRFNHDGFNDFVNENKSFLDSDVKVGIFGVGVLVRFLFDIQSVSLNNTPFENKLRGYKLNPELLMNVYTEALDKIQKYQKSFYVYTDLREVINQYFVVNSHELNKMTNNELSFYFVAGLELGKHFKKAKLKIEETE